MTSDPRASGVPVLAGPGASGQPLERLPLAPRGKSHFDEAWLQRLIHENPACLPIAELEPGLDPFNAICCEMPTPRGYLDNLLMTGRGDIALVEAKLFRNPEARRQALAQALDYATSLFAMGYETFEKAALAGNFAPRAKPSSLYAALPDAEKLSEEAFADAVSHNLHRGRAIILIAGDGIREEAELLLEGLQAHARLGFTLALIELAVFRLPAPSDQLLIRPRTLAKTSIIRRTIVEISATGAANVRDEQLAAPRTLSTEAFWESLEVRVPGATGALEKLIRDVEPEGVYPEFLKSLVFRWDRPGVRPVNLGYVSGAASIWTDFCAQNIPPQLAQNYVTEVAAVFDAEVHTMPTAGTWTPYRQGRPLKLGAVLDRLDAWIGPMRRFIAAITEHDEAEAG